MRYDIVLSPEAFQDFKRLKGHVRAAAREAFEAHLRHEPAKVSKSRIKKLRGLSRPQYRLRVQEIRVFYDIVGSRVEILAIIPKSQALSWLEHRGKRS
jgi:mRNA-degrading endonuclease RelE of RelBE toxin-antitoxin system